MDSHGFLFYRWHEPPSSAAVLALHQLITADSVDSVDSDPSRPRAPSRLGRKSPSLSGSAPWAPANTAPRWSVLKPGSAGSHTARRTGQMGVLIQKVELHGVFTHTIPCTPLAIGRREARSERSG